MTRYFSETPKRITFFVIVLFKNEKMRAFDKDQPVQGGSNGWAKLQQTLEKT